ncbi:MAG: methyltransferase domain-containing protein [Candidatus Andersenbacteria bacterium]
MRGNKLNQPGGSDVIVLIHGREVERGRTVAVQDFAAYGARDYGRPARDPKTGSLPPKLAQAMVNLAEVVPGGRIHDPFVGTGTVLQEALLLGYQTSGSDLDPGMVAKAKTNLDWLRTQYRPGLAASPLEAAPADKFTAPPASLDAVVTEGTLGHGPADAPAITDLWRKVLVYVRPLLKPGGTIVLTWPVFTGPDGSGTAVSLLDELPKLGYRAQDLLPKHSSLRYERPGQVVRRQLYRLTPA